jgi:hypothetical protein
VKKIYIITFIVLTLFFFLIQNEIGKKDSKINFIKSKIPENIKTILNEKIFVYKNQKLLKNEIHSNNLKIEESLQKLNEIPFLLGYVPFSKDTNNLNFEIDNNKFSIEKFKTNILNIAKYKNAKGTSYLEIFEDKIILINANGIFSFFDKKEFENEEFKSKIINSNIKEIIKYKKFYLNSRFGIKDALIDNDNNIYISLSYEKEKNCYNTSILKAKMNLNYLNFEKFFIPNKCIKVKNDYGEFSAFHSGGRIISNKNELIVSMGEYRYRPYAQNPENIFGKIISINKGNKKIKIIAMGLRNPQGIFYDNREDILFISEHGPRGGDEINIKKGLYQSVTNFGWPISSYGEHYPHETEKKTKSIYKKAPLYKSHKKYGFEEPLIYFNPGVAPSEILKLSRSFLENTRNINLLLGTMGNNVLEGDRSLHFISLDQNLKIQNRKIVELNERVRDIVFDKDENQVIMFLENSASIAVINKLN